MGFLSDKYIIFNFNKLGFVMILLLYFYLLLANIKNEADFMTIF